MKQKIIPLHFVRIHISHFLSCIFILMKKITVCQLYCRLELLISLLTRRASLPGHDGSFESVDVKTIDIKEVATAHSDFSLNIFHSKIIRSTDQKISSIISDSSKILGIISDPFNSLNLRPLSYSYPCKIKRGILTRWFYCCLNSSTIPYQTEYRLSMIFFIYIYIYIYIQQFILTVNVLIPTYKY